MLVGCRNSFRSSWTKLYLAAILFLVIRDDGDRVEALPPGFRDEGVVREKQTVGFNFIPNIDDPSKHMLLTTRKKGKIMAVLDSDLADNKSPVIEVLDIEDKVCTDGERGVYQVLPHPDFIYNRYVYVFFTYDKNGGCEFSPTDGPVNAVARYKLKGSTDGTTNPLRLENEQIIFMSNPLPSKVHNGGDMKFGNDGYLYVTLGNGGLSVEYGNAQKANTLLGSIVRITDDGGIPYDNPFQGPYDEPCGKDGRMLSKWGRCSEIWATGLRNPFRFALDPNVKKRTRFYVNDVGGSFFEEVNLMTGDRGGQNYGYREREGPCYRMSNTDCEPQTIYTDPIYWYEHVNRTDAALTGGAFVPNGIWPDYYDGKYLIADYVFRTISLLEEDETMLCRDCTPPLPGFSKSLFRNLTDIGQPLQMTFGPYKDSLALYYSLWGQNGKYSIRRIIYEGHPSGNSNGHLAEKHESWGKIKEEQGDNISESSNEKGKNSIPIAKILIDGQNVESGQNYGVDQVVFFDASESFDLDGDDLQYSWNFGDRTGATKIKQPHAYSKPGEYWVMLAVRDSHGYIGTVSRMITIGTPPRPSMILPRENENFAVGDTLTLLGTAMDADGNYLDDSNMSWEVRQVHNTHYHPFLDPTEGNFIKTSPAPTPEDFLAATNSFLRVILTVTDPKTNITGSMIRDVMPETTLLHFRTDPPGLELTFDGYNVRTPDEDGVSLSVTTWIRHNFTINARDQEDMIFVNWNDGSTERQRKIMIEESDYEVNARSERSVKIITAQFKKLKNVEIGNVGIEGNGTESGLAEIVTIHKPDKEAIDSFVQDIRYEDGVESTEDSKAIDSFLNGVESTEDSNTFEGWHTSIDDSGGLRAQQSVMVPVFMFILFTII